MTKQMMILATEAHRQRALNLVRSAELGVVIELKEKTRNLSQNALLWAALGDVSRQVEYYGKKYSPDAWKNIFSGSLKAMESVPAIGGGIVMIGQSTSNMSKREFSELIELIFSFGAENGVKFSDNARGL
jgi:hypothetical protein